MEEKEEAETGTFKKSGNLVGGINLSGNIQSLDFPKGMIVL